MSSRIEQLIKEELTRSDVNSMLNSYVKDSELDKRIKDVVSDTMEKFFKTMFTKKTLWRSELK